MSDRLTVILTFESVFRWGPEMSQGFGLRGARPPVEERMPWDDRYEQSLAAAALAKQGGAKVHDPTPLGVCTRLGWFLTAVSVPAFSAVVGAAYFMPRLIEVSKEPVSAGSLPEVSVATLTPVLLASPAVSLGIAVMTIVALWLQFIRRMGEAELPVLTAALAFLAAGVFSALLFFLTGELKLPLAVMLILFAWGCVAKVPEED